MHLRLYIILSLPEYKMHAYNSSLSFTMKISQLLYTMNIRKPKLKFHYNFNTDV